MDKVIEIEELEALITWLHDEDDESWKYANKKLGTAHMEKCSTA